MSMVILLTTSKSKYQKNVDYRGKLVKKTRNVSHGKFCREKQSINTKVSTPNLDTDKDR